MTLTGLYKHSLSLLTDLYQISMGLGYWKCGRQDRQATFLLSFRTLPFDGGFALVAGLERAVDFIQAFRFDDDDIEYLRSLRGSRGGPLFPVGFLEYLRDLRLTCNVESVPEGTPVLAGTPVLRVTGPLLQCQLLETPLLNFINFETLIATKAARICMAARDDAVLEFGLRRAHGIDGALSASRAAHIGGCAATSNLLAGKLLGIPVRGTHGHSWVLSFRDEPDAFRHYGEAMPDDCVFLVDTYDSRRGLDHAIQAAGQLEEKGHRVLAIRLDSGDLLRIGNEARGRLDRAKLKHVAIVASGDLDEFRIARLKGRGSPITIWAVGTQLTTGGTSAAMTGVYKLAAVQDRNGEWRDTMKLSDDLHKVSCPGILEVKRLLDGDGRHVADVAYDTRLGLGGRYLPMGPSDVGERCHLPSHSTRLDLLERVVSGGKPAAPSPSLHNIRRRARSQLKDLGYWGPDGESPLRPTLLLEERVFEKMQERLRSQANPRTLS